QTQDFAPGFLDFARNDRKLIIYSSFAPSAPFRNATVRDAISGVDHRLQIPTRTRLHGSRRLGALRHPAFDVPRGNVLPQIRRAPARQCTSVRRIRGNPPPGQRVPVIDYNLLRPPAPERHAKILPAALGFCAVLRATLVRYATFHICPREEAPTRDGTNRLSACR